MAEVPEGVIRKIIKRLGDGENYLTITHPNPAIGSAHYGPDVAQSVAAILADRLTRQDPDIRRAALEEAANDLSRFADIETERAEGKREGSTARFAALWASIRLRLAASHVRALSDKGGEHG